MYPKSGGCRSYLIAELPDHERPRERLSRLGPDSLSDIELLAILLRSGTAGRSVLELSRELFSVFEGDLSRLATATSGELQRIHGIGPAKALELQAAFSLACRLSMSVGRIRAQVESPAQVADLMREKFRTKKQEEFHVLLLDTKHYLLRDECVTVGLLDRSQVHAREVFRTAIKESCARVILVHNHPSGDPTPSSQDISCTKNLVSAGKIIGIDILDHIVIGTRNSTRTTDYLSFREENLL